MFILFYTCNSFFFFSSRIFFLFFSSSSRFYFNRKFYIFHNFFLLCLWNRWWTVRKHKYTLAICQCIYALVRRMHAIVTSTSEWRWRWYFSFAIFFFFFSSFRFFSSIFFLLHHLLCFYFNPKVRFLISASMSCNEGARTYTGITYFIFVWFYIQID